MVANRFVEVGARDAPVSVWARAVVRGSELDGTAIAWIRVDHRDAGAITMSDPVRADAPRTLRRLRAAGVTKVVLLTGDRESTAREVGTVLGVDEVYAGQTPADKVACVEEECRSAVTVMVGDGVNDAPALASASVGAALGAHGTTASTATADVVLTTDGIGPLASAMEIARRSRRIAVQSAGIGMALSIGAMLVAALGWLPPTAGALLQEAIDVAVILNALRALTGPRSVVHVDDPTGALLRRFSTEHEMLRTKLRVLVDGANDLAGQGIEASSGDGVQGLRRADDLLAAVVLPHEHAEESLLYPALAKPLGTTEATVTMSRMHAEIDRLARRVHAHRMHADRNGQITADQRLDVMATLYGLHALLRLHFSEEEQNYFTLVATPGTGTALP